MEFPEWYVKYCFECECNGEVPQPLKGADFAINETKRYSLIE